MSKVPESRLNRRSAALAMFGFTMMVVTYGQARAYGSEAPALSSVSPGAAEAPQLVVGSAMRIERDEANVETLHGPYTFVAPAPTAPVETTAPVEDSLRWIPVAEAGPECFATIGAYNEAWWATGVAPVNPCFAIPEPNNQDQPEDVERHQDGEAF